MNATYFNAAKNRYIDVTDCGNTYTLVIGSPKGASITKVLPKKEYESYILEKTGRGYELVDLKKTEQRVERHPVLAKLAELSKQIVENTVKTNFIPSKEDLDKARETLLKMSSLTDLSEFNTSLYHIFSLIPRKMHNPILFTAKNQTDFKNILEREDELLDNLEVSSNTTTVDSDINFEECSKEEIEKIKEMLDHSTLRKFRTAYKVSNTNQDKKFENYCKVNRIEKTKLLFHGSRTENWFSIIKTNLRVNPVNVIVTGKMYGNGIYFAPKADKSCGYTDLSGSRWAKGTDNVAYLGLFEVATGNEYITDSWDSGYQTLDENLFIRRFPKKNSLHAKAGRYLMNDEIVVYNDCAAHIKYLIELQK